MPNRKNIIDFIKEFKEKHSDKYDYSLVDYKNRDTKIKIICKLHGVFEQSPRCHLKYSGCSKCLAERSINQKMGIDINTSYMIGLFQTDGSMSLDDRNRGKFQLEIAHKDEDIIYKLEKLIPYHVGIKKRSRNNILNGYTYNNNKSIIMTIWDKNFRRFLLESGIPYGLKSKIIKPPLNLSNLSILDYIRGLYDGDGSLGMTSQNIPYVSFTTDSDNIGNFLVNYISKLTGKTLKIMKRNNRDNIYNIVITKEDAVNFCNEIYYENCLSLDRKYNKAIEIKKWIRPIDMKFGAKRK